MVELRLLLAVGWILDLLLLLLGMREIRGFCALHGVARVPLRSGMHHRWWHLLGLPMQCGVWLHRLRALQGLCLLAGVVPLLHGLQREPMSGKGRRTAIGLHLKDQQGGDGSLERTRDGTEANR